MKIKNLLYKISYISILSALIFICSAFIVIPYAGGAGYFNLSDALILFSTIYFGPVIGFFSGIIGASLGDFYGGYINCIPFTIVAKGLESIVCFFIYKMLYNKETLKNVMYYFSTFFMVLTYFIYYLVIYNGDFITSLTFSGFDLIQGTVSYLFSLALLFLFQKINLKTKFKYSN